MILEIQQAAHWTEWIVALILIINSFELYSISQEPSFKAIWSLDHLNKEFYMSLPFPKFLINGLFSIKGFRFTLISLLWISFYSFFAPSFSIYILMGVLHLLINMRFRGNFNGGSDTMTFVLLTGLSIMHFSHSERSQKWGLIYIGVHAMYSYFKAGLAKIRHSEWRSGTAITDFLSESLMESKWIALKIIKTHRFFPPLIAWMTLGFELGIVSLFIYPNRAVYYALMALVFHFFIFLFFGLNRFFWVWMGAWPGIIIFVQSVKNF